MQGGKGYFSGKHKLYEYKVELSVRPNFFGSFNKQYPRSTWYLGIFTERSGLQKNRLMKREEEEFEAEFYCQTGMWNRGSF